MVHYPVSLSKNVTVPPRTVESVVTLTDLPEPETKIMYKMITVDNPKEPWRECYHLPSMLCHHGRGKAEMCPNRGKPRAGKAHP